MSGIIQYPLWVVYRLLILSLLSLFLMITNSFILVIVLNADNVRYFKESSLFQCLTIHVDPVKTQITLFLARLAVSF